MNALSAPLIYRKGDLCNQRGRHYPGLLNVSESKFYEMIRTGEFPEPNFIVGRTRGWTADLIEKWVADNRTDG